MEHIAELFQQIEKVGPTNALNAVKRLKRDFAKKYNISDIPSNVELLKEYRALVASGDYTANKQLELLLKKRGVRSESGIVPIQVLTKPFWCPGKCIFCPNDATMPKSYINTEPGAMRALLNQFDPYKQAYNRLLSLHLTGHDTDKIEMIVLGGTWDVYPNDYKRDFLKGLYDACNTFDQFLANNSQITGHRSQGNSVGPITYDLSGIAYPETIEESMTINETSNHRIIGLTIETRPEYMTDENCQMWRSWGVTRLEMGLQSMYDDVLDANKRGHSVQQAREAMHKMRQYGFKFSVHFMPGLYGSTVEKDIETFRLAYNDPFIKPDEIKFYPTSVIPNTELYELYRKGAYKPLETDDIVHIIRTVQLDIIPPYTRIKRLIRDIPSTEIAAGSSVTNLRQLTETDLLSDLAKDEAMRATLYSRLYNNAKIYQTLDEWLINLKSGEQKAELDTGETIVVGEMPDMTSVRNFVSLDTRAREIRNRKLNGKSKEQRAELNMEDHGFENPISKIEDREVANLIIRKYQSSVGTEYFISYEDELGYLYGFTRLLLPKEGETIEREGLGAGTALIRELHVYGQLAAINGESKEQRAEGNKVQHKGFGSRLMAAAEQIAKQAGYERLSVISGVGVREYYKKIGYHKEGTYMVKDL